jgi:DNA-binding MarR family transcriptional regulator
MRLQTKGEERAGGRGDGPTGDVEEASGLRVALVRIQRQLRSKTASDITPSQSGPVRLGTLAELEGTTAATMSRVIDSLADRHLIERVPDPLDGRASLVRLTVQGGALLHELRARYTEVLRAAMAELTGEEQRVVRRAIPVLERLSDLLQAGDRGPLG